MQRKYIYAIVIWLTIILVTTEYYFNFNVYNKNISENELSEKFDETYGEIQKNIELNSTMTIKNIQNDDKNISYIYKIEIDDVVGAKRILLNNKEKFIVFTANGEAQILLNSNESITIYDLPENTKFSVEQINELADTYITKINNEEKSSITGSTSIETNLEFENNVIVKEPIKEEQEEVKEEIKKEEQDNPVTEDSIKMTFILVITLLVIVILLKNIKIKRFE